MISYFYLPVSNAFEHTDVDVSLKRSTSLSSSQDNIELGYHSLKPQQRACTDGCRTGLTKFHAVKEKEEALKEIKGSLIDWTTGK